MENLILKAKGRELTFYFDLAAWFDIEKEFGSLDEMNRRLNEGDHPLEASLLLAAITATAGARQNGDGEAVTVDELKELLTPRQANRAIALAKQAFVIGMQRDEEEPEEQAVDVVAEELQKKTASEA